MLAKLWSEHRAFSEVVSLLPSDLPQELSCNVGATTPVLPADTVTKFAVSALILSEKLPCPMQSDAGAPPLCVAIQQRNVRLVRSVSQGACTTLTGVHGFKTDSWALAGGC